MSIFNRLFSVFKAEANAVVDKMEDPVKTTEQGIRDLKADLDKAVQALAEIKGLEIREKKSLVDAKNKLSESEKKSAGLIAKIEGGSVKVEDVEHLLEKLDTSMTGLETDVATHEKNLEKFTQNREQMEKQINKLKTNITKYEGELRSLKSRSKASEATERINKQLTKINDSTAVSRLERMKEKVDAQEARSEAYAEIAEENKSMDEEIDDVIGSGMSALDKLKARQKA